MSPLPASSRPSLTLPPSLLEEDEDMEENELEALSWVQM
jgi:hypothetical protein